MTESPTTSERIGALIRPTLDHCGVELCELQWGTHGRSGLLRILIDKPGGVTLGDCERVSAAVGPVLDVHEVIPTSYRLEVSSPGAERPVRNEDEWRTAIGRRLNVRLRNGDGELVLEGRVLNLTDELLEIEVRDGKRRRPQTVARADVLAARIVVDI